MKKIKRMIAVLLMLCLCCTCTCVTTLAAGYNDFQFREGEKLSSASTLTRGLKQLTRGTSKRKGFQYQIVKMANGKLTLRPQEGYWMSDDPYFQNKTITCKISPTCKFYYTDVCYIVDGKLVYKQMSKKAVLKRMKEFQIYHEKIEGKKKKYYTGGYFGEMYVKGGKVVAILTNGGD